MKFNFLLARLLKYLKQNMALIYHNEFRHDRGELIVNLEMLIFKEDDTFIAYAPALDISAFGDTEEKAKDEFNQTMLSYLNYCLNKKTLFKDLQAHGWTVKSKKRIKAPSEDKLIEMNETYKDIRENKEYKSINKEVCIPAV